MTNIQLFFLVCMLMFATASVASVKTFGDPRLEQRAQALEKQIRCTVCAGQSIYESNAEIALAMRALVREDIMQGRTDDDILNGFRVRYGDDVVLAPPIAGRTLILWGGPLGLLCGLIFMGWRYQRRMPPSA